MLVDPEGMGCVLNENGSTGRYVNCLFRHHFLGAAGAVINDASDPSFINCLFDQNTALRGAGMHNIHANPLIDHCTFVRNVATEDVGSAILSEGISEPLITNSIFWHNDAPATQIQDLGSARTTVRYSNTETPWPGEGNIAADPLFVDPDAGNWRLTSGSPSIDSGHNWFTPPDLLDLDSDRDTDELIPLDFEGNPRFADDPETADTGCGSGIVVDMGAYEHPGDVLEPMKLGDIDGNGVVGLPDLLTLLDEYGPCSPGCCSADLNLDGVVGLSDLLLLLDRWDRILATFGEIPGPGGPGLWAPRST